VKALRYPAWDVLDIADVEEPVLRAGEAILDVAAVGICGSELEAVASRSPRRTPPLVMGHEFCGEVIAVAPDVTDVKVGDRVVANSLIPCGRCRECRTGATHLCPERGIFGMNRPGAFAERVAVPAGVVLPLPERVSPLEGALVEPLANGVHAARVGRAGVEAGPVERVVVLGAGTIGLMTLQAALVGGASWAGVVELHPARRALAEALGAHGTYSAESVPGDADIVFDAVGAESTRRLAIDLLRPGGCAVFIGLATDSTALRFHEVIRGGLTVRGSYAYSDADYDEALRWLLDGRAGLGELEPVLPLDAGPDAFAELSTGPSERLKVFLA
jgi:(R,R)-butanediol dehydrogenase / meso-butanediol dehydrogenase / diacetyl reductase